MPRENIRRGFGEMVRASNPTSISNSNMLWLLGELGRMHPEGDFGCDAEVCLCGPCGCPGGRGPDGVWRQFRLEQLPEEIGSGFGWFDGDPEDAFRRASQADEGWLEALEQARDLTIEEQILAVESGLDPEAVVRIAAEMILDGEPEEVLRIAAQMAATDQFAAAEAA